MTTMAVPHLQLVCRPRPSFLFEAFDSYIPLFYLAFYEQDILLLRAELVGL